MASLLKYFNLCWLLGFLGMKPFSSQFLYIFRLLNFFFSSDYYAILMSNSFTLVHFCTLMPPLQLVFFCFVLKTIDTMIYLNRVCLTTKTAIHHFMKNSFLPLQHTAPFLFFFSPINRHFTSENFYTKKKTKKNGKNNSNLSLLMLYFWSDWSLQACRGSCTGLNFFFSVLIFTTASVVLITPYSFIYPQFPYEIFINLQSVNSEWIASNRILGFG